MPVKINGKLFSKKNYMSADDLPAQGPPVRAILYTSSLRCLIPSIGLSSCICREYELVLATFGTPLLVERSNRDINGRLGIILKLYYKTILQPHCNEGTSQEEDSFI